ncbi:MAG: ribosome biogenesis GTPase Der [Alphaproteobacteria bacterium]
MVVAVAIVGRPNVGKSSLFNKLVGRKAALVDATPGLTRDWREESARLGRLDFVILDTPGLEDAPPDSLQAAMRAQTEKALARADLALFVIDALTGITPADADLARWLRRLGKPVILVANKCESGRSDTGRLDSYRLGFGEPVAVSAAHGLGFGDLEDALAPHLLPPESESPADTTEAGDMPPEEEEGEEAETEAVPRPLTLAIVGRPNVGKSTLVNRLLGEERRLTGPEPGLTRESVALDWVHNGQSMRLVDTAGLRRRARVTESVEKLSAEDTLNAIRFADVVAIVLDARDMLEHQDISIASHVIEEGRAFVLVVNKWDLVEDRPQALRKLEDRIAQSLPEARGAPLVMLSALSGQGIEKLQPAVIAAFDAWNTRLATGALNRWLAEATERHPPPRSGAGRNRLRYMTQGKARPPTFILFVNRPDEMPGSYMRYLENNLRDVFKLFGTPLRLRLRRGRNPFDKEKD